MAKWIPSILLLFGFLSFFVYKAALRRNPAQVSLVSETDKEELREKILCAFDRINETDRFYNTYSKSRSTITLDLIYGKLAEGFARNDITSDVEKSHFLAQVFHETSNFLYTIEKYGSQRWRNVLRAADLSMGWDCDAYYAAAKDEKDIFDSSYVYSKNSYKAAFRGRGLIHMTHCYNYLNFFYNSAAFRLGFLDLVRNQNENFWYRNSSGKITEILDVSFCTDEMLDNIVDFGWNGVPFEPYELLDDGSGSTTSSFENTVNELSLPCHYRGFSTMSSLEFLSDSAFNYWGRCRRGDFNGHRTGTLASSVAMMSQCIMHPYWRAFRALEDRHCTSEYIENRKEGRSEWTLVSEEGRRRYPSRLHDLLNRHCHRLRNFRAIHSCFAEI